MLIEKYTPNWINNFIDIKLKIDLGLQGIEYSIEHIGSTAVPNLDSKPIIDIDIIHACDADWHKIKSSLAKIGYVHHGNQGIEDREVFKRNGKLTCETLDTIKHHLYVC
ncbi:MAG: GrpB family protein, partial [Pedobacter sp.]